MLCRTNVILCQKNRCEPVGILGMRRLSYFIYAIDQGKLCNGHQRITQRMG